MALSYIIIGYVKQLVVYSMTMSLMFFVLLCVSAIKGEGLTVNSIHEHTCTSQDGVYECLSQIPYYSHSVLTMYLYQLQPSMLSGTSMYTLWHLLTHEQHDVCVTSKDFCPASCHTSAAPSRAGSYSDLPTNHSQGRSSTTRYTEGIYLCSILSEVRCGLMGMPVYVRYVHLYLMSRYPTLASSLYLGIHIRPDQRIVKDVIDLLYINRGVLVKCSWVSVIINIVWFVDPVSGLCAARSRSKLLPKSWLLLLKITST